MLGHELIAKHHLRPSGALFRMFWCISSPFACCGAESCFRLVSRNLTRSAH